jgi:hypothetical protein
LGSSRPLQVSFQTGLRSLPSDKLIQFKKFASDYFEVSCDLFVLQRKRGTAVRALSFE